MMRQVSVSKSEAWREDFRRVYESSFPDEEKIPYAELLRLMDLLPIAFTAWYDDDLFVGITIVCEWPHADWFWYFAVDDKLRGRGYGASILKALTERYAGRAFVLDIESPRQSSANIEQRKRRYAFYLRNGLCDTGIERSFSGVSYAVLASCGVQFTGADYDRLLDDLRRCWDSMPQRE